MTANTANESAITDCVSSPYVANETSSECAQAVIRDNCTAIFTRCLPTHTCNGYPSTTTSIVPSENPTVTSGITESTKNYIGYPSTTIVGTLPVVVVVVSTTIQ